MSQAIEPLPGWCEEQFLAHEGARGGEGAGSFAAPVRRQAFTRLKEGGIPTTKSEEWKYTNILPVIRRQHRLPSGQLPVSPEQVEQLLPLAVTPHRIVFVNGVFDSRLSSASFPKGLSFARLENLLQHRDGAGPEVQLIETHLGHHAQAHGSWVAALNTSFLAGGAVLKVEPGAGIVDPIALVFISQPLQDPLLLTPRVLVLAAEQSKACFLELHAGIGGGDYLSNPVTEIVVERHATVAHHKIVLESQAANHLSMTDVVMKEESRFQSYVLSFGGRLVRNELRTSLKGQHIESSLHGLTVLAQDQHVDNHTTIVHAKPNSFSREMYKGIYGGKSEGVFSGTIVVEHEAQKTNAVQSSQSLLLTDAAKVESRPQLKIWADDVKCTHGATVGQLDENALFYLRSLGIEAASAKGMLIQAFASEVIKEIQFPPLREFVERKIQEKLKEAQG